MSLPNTTVLITDYNYPSLAIEEEIFSAAGIRMITAQASNVQEVIDAGRDADAILNQYAPITAEVLGNLPRCRAIVRYGIGVDNIDLKAARNKAIPVANVPTYGIQEVADHTMTLTLALLRKLPQIQQLVKKGVWEGSPCRPIFEMAGQRFGLLGCGRIGQAVARRARGFDFEVIGYDPFLSDKQLLEIGIEPVDFTSLISSSDLISLHLPLNEQTHHVIDTETFQLMRDEAFLINCSRGGLVNSDALVEALQKPSNCRCSARCGGGGTYWKRSSLIELRKCHRNQSCGMVLRRINAETSAHGCRRNCTGFEWGTHAKCCERRMIDESQHVVDRTIFPFDPRLVWQRFPVRRDSLPPGFA